jgi:hypothetical protein
VPIGDYVITGEEDISLWFAGEDGRDGFGSVYNYPQQKEDGQWYAVYHARDYGDAAATNSFDARNARICKMTVENGVITAYRSKDHI